MSRFVSEELRRWLRRQADKIRRAEELDDAISSMEVEIEKQARKISKLEAELASSERLAEGYKTLRNGEMMFSGRLVNIMPGVPTTPNFSNTPPFWSLPSDGIDFTLHMVGQMIVAQQSRRVLAGRPIAIRFMNEE